MMKKIDFDRIFAFIAGVQISCVSAWYSIVGLTAIFSGAFWSIIIMGVSLEIGKIITAAYLYRNWESLKIPFRIYFLIAVVILMVITSMGTFGYLSKAHIEQGADAVNVEAQVERLDLSIAREQARIERADGVIQQLDSAIDVMIGLEYATRGLDTRNEQAPERLALNVEIEEAQVNVDNLQDERLELTQAVRDLQREVGPIRYVAELIYGDSTEDLLAQAVRAMIILIVLVFDPLAILLIMISTKPTNKDEELSNAVSATEDWEPMDVVVQKNVPAKKPFVKIGDAIYPT